MMEVRDKMVERMTRALVKVRGDYVSAMYQVDALAELEKRIPSMEEKLRKQECQSKIDLIDYALGQPLRPSAPTDEMFTEEWFETVGPQ